ncbi:MAG: TIGR01244 family phosphatase [Devosia sp.]|nr:TIGR01244 family phosphatase [Devosia sp.]
MNIKTIDGRFATTGQIQPEDVAQLAQDGYVAIVCARPDDEEPGQPAFAAIAREAEKHGIKAIHIPVSGSVSSDQIARFKTAMAPLEGPVLGYCRSGARAGALYSSLAR